jgi:AbrB family looped-hinge helix DNA binding protein
METVVVTPDFHVVLPKSLCDAMGIRPGQSVQLVPYNNRIELIPAAPIQAARGFLKGIDTDVPREADRL